MRNPDVAKAQAQLRQLSADPATLELARTRQLALDTQRIEAAANRREGFQEGLQQGIEKGKIESISRSLLRLLEAKFGVEAARAAQPRLEGASLEALEVFFQKALVAASYQDIF